MILRASSWLGRQAERTASDAGKASKRTRMFESNSTVHASLLVPNQEAANASAALSRGARGSTWVQYERDSSTQREQRRSRECVSVTSDGTTGGGGVPGTGEDSSITRS